MSRGWEEVPIQPEIKSKIEPGTRAYVKQVPDGHLRIMVSPPSPEHETGWHLSISYGSAIASGIARLRYPTWDEIRDARYDWIPNEVTMAMILPPKEQYVNIHDNCFHLHEIPS